MLNCSVEPYTPDESETFETMGERNSANLALMVAQGLLPDVTLTEHDRALIATYGLTPEA